MKLVELKASLNLGLSNELKKAFPNVVVNRIIPALSLEKVDPY
jgi:hypothetical protein